MLSRRVLVGASTSRSGSSSESTREDVSMAFTGTIEVSPSLHSRKHVPVGRPLLKESTSTPASGPSARV